MKLTVTHGFYSKEKERIIEKGEVIELEEVRADLLEEDPSYRITLLKAEMVDISSTTIRNATVNGQDMSEWLM